MIDAILMFLFIFSLSTVIATTGLLLLHTVAYILGRIKDPNRKKTRVIKKKKTGNE